MGQELIWQKFGKVADYDEIEFKVDLSFEAVYIIDTDEILKPYGRP